MDDAKFFLELAVTGGFAAAAFAVLVFTVMTWVPDMPYSVALSGDARP